MFLDFFCFFYLFQFLSGEEGGLDREVQMKLSRFFEKTKEKKKRKRASSLEIPQKNSLEKHHSEFEPMKTGSFFGNKFRSVFEFPLLRSIFGQHFFCC